MHLTKVNILAGDGPTSKHYPFNLKILRATTSLEFTTPVTFFIGENGAGKSTLLEALAHRCRIHIWRPNERSRCVYNPHEDELYKYLTVEWTDGPVPGSFFAADIFKNFAQNLDEWAASDPGQLKYFGGQSLLTQSHGQSLMSFFRNRYLVKGLYLLDEPETALSPTSQLELLRLLKEIGRAGHAQFIVASHSPILLACPGATIYSFDHVPVREIGYQDTEHYRVYKDFLDHPDKYL
jgi:predicted ATPase